MPPLLFFTVILLGLKLVVSVCFLLGHITGCRCAALGQIDRGRYRRGVKNGTIEKRPLDFMTLDQIDEMGILDLVPRET